MTSLLFNPKKFKSLLSKAQKELKTLKHPIDDSEETMQALEAKYHLDTAKLKQIGIIK
jgi:hypothetical protein